MRDEEPGPTVLGWIVAVVIFLMTGYAMYKHAECKGLYSWSPQPAGQVCP